MHWDQQFKDAQQFGHMLRAICNTRGAQNFLRLSIPETSLQCEASNTVEIKLEAALKSSNLTIRGWTKSETQALVGTEIWNTPEPHAAPLGWKLPQAHMLERIQSAVFFVHELVHFSFWRGNCDAACMGRQPFGGRQAATNFCAETATRSCSMPKKSKTSFLKSKSGHQMTI